MNEEAQKIQLLRSLRDTNLRTKEDLDYYLRAFYGVYLAKVPIEEGNSCPLDFVWDVYNTAMSGHPTDIFNFLAVAGRGAQKSLSCGALETLLLTHDQDRDYFHMASIKQQSKVTYNYVQSFYKRPLLAETIEKCIMSETRTRFDKQLIIGTGTMDSVNSFHGSVIQDEVDLTPPAVFKESKGMLTAQKGKMALNVCISSRKFGFGNVQELLDKALRKNFPLKIYKWTILEVTEKCKDDRSGKHGVTYYVDNENLETLTEDQFFLIKDQTKRDKYEKVVGYENCARCGIFSFCKGNLKKQEEDNPYLQPIEQVRSLFFTDDLWFFLAQRLNRRPSTKGLVFPMWDEASHVKSYNQMAEILTGQQSANGKELTLNDMIALFQKYHCDAYIGVDFGFNCGVALLIFVDGSERMYVVDEIRVSGYSDADFAFECQKEWGEFRMSIVRGFPDVASPQGIKEFSKYFPMVKEDKEYNKLSKIPEFRAGNIRKFLKGPGSGLVRLFVHYNCGGLREEIPFYHYKIDPKTEEPTEVIEKKNDHSIDGLGNILVGLFGITKTQVTVADEAKDIARMPVMTAPTPMELAEFVGRGGEFIDNRHQFESEAESDEVMFDFA